LKIENGKLKKDAMNTVKARFVRIASFSIFNFQFSISAKTERSDR